MSCASSRNDFMHQHSLRYDGFRTDKTMSLISRMQLRTRLAILVSGLVLAISVAIVFYVQIRLMAVAKQSIAGSALSLADMTAHGIAESLVADDPIASAPVLAALREHEDLAWVMVLDEQGETLAAFNQTLAEQSAFRQLGREVSAQRRAGVRRTEASGGYTPDGRVFQARTPIRVRGQSVGELYLGLSLDRAAAEVDAGRGAVAGAALVVFVTGLLGAFVIGEWIVGPVNRIASTVRRIAEGDRTERVSVRGDDEVALLGRTFNVMIERLESARISLENSNLDLEERVRLRSVELESEIEERVRAELAQRRSEEQYRLLFERNLAGVYVADGDGKLFSANPACAQMFGFDHTEEFISDGAIRYDEPALREEILRRVRAEETIVNLEVQLVRKNGIRFWAIESLRSVPGEGVIEGILLDISARKKAELEIEYRAHHDPLTRLPNRNLLYDRLEMAIAFASRHERLVGVLFLDIDDLKGINNTLGHQGGDEVLQQIGKRLQRAVRTEDTVARIGGDEFAIVVPGISRVEHLEAVAQNLVRALKPPILIDRDEIHVSASIGAAYYPTDGIESEDLLRRADSTMYRVKTGGGAGYRLATKVESAQGLRRLTRESELQSAMDLNQLIVQYQPQYDLLNQQLSGVEALVRLQLPDGSIVPPDHFVPLAENTGLIIPLGEFVIRRACRDLKEWRSLTSAPLHMGINVSPRQLHQQDFLGLITEIFSSAEIEPPWIEFEITESIAVRRSAWTMDLLHQIREIGVRIAVDDFGTGSSSLSYLKTFPIDTVKIDRSFCSGMLDDVHDRTIVTAILHIAEKLSLRTVAEGVETGEQAEFLRENGCREAQGFLYSQSVNASEISRLITRSSPNSESSGRPVTARQGDQGSDRRREE